MSSMVLTQLLNPESGIDRPGPGKAVDNGAQSRPDNGPSRYDEIVRQQEQRLEKRRTEERATARQRQDEARHSDRQQEKTVAARQQDKTSADGKTDAATERRAERSERGEGDRQQAETRESGSREHDGGNADRRTAESSQAGREGDRQPDTDEQVTRKEVADTELIEALAAGGNIELSEDALQGLMAPAMGPMQGGGAQPLTTAQAQTAAQVMASLTGAGQQKPGSTPAAGALFAAILEAGQDSRGKGGDLLAGLQNGSLQAVPEGTAKLADTLTAQVASRMSAPELTQTLNQGASLRGQEAQALMRNYSTSVDAPVGADEWGEKVMGKLAWLTASQMSVAEIHVTPPDLGPLDVRVQVQNDQATVTVHATTPAVREQLELHGHRLRDMLSEQGLSLEGFDVSDSAGRETADQHGDGDDAEGRDGRGPVTGELADSDAEPLNSGELDLSWRGEVDLYA